MLEIYPNILLFLLMNCIVAVSAINLLKLFFSYSLADRILIFALAFCSQVIITELTLGILNILTLNNVIFLNLIVLLFGVLFIKKIRPQQQPVFFKESPLLGNKTVVFVLSCIIGFGLVKVFFNLINPPFGWDCLNYHFTFPVEWLKNRNLLNPMVINCDPSPPYYPITGSLIFLWLILPFKSVFLADLGQAPFFILCFISAFSIARKIGIAKDYAYFAAALFVLIPNFFKQLEIAYVDTIFCAFFLISVNFLFALSLEFNLRNLLLSAISLGLAFGTKTIAIPLGAVLIVFFVIILLRRLFRRSLSLAPRNDASTVIASESAAGGRAKQSLLYFAIGGITVIMLGGFSYIRNFILTGNFLYPANFYIFGNKIMRGVLDISYYKAHYLPWDFSLSKLLFHEGLGSQTIILTLPALFLSIPLTFKKNRQKLNLEFIYFLIMPILLYLVYRFVIPLSASRYLYPALGLGLVIAFYCIETLKINKRIVYALVIICTIASLSELTRKIQIFYSFLATGLTFAAACFLSLRGVPPPKVAGRRSNLFLDCFATSWLAMTGSIAVILLLGLIQKDYLGNEFSRYLKPVMAKPVFWPDAAKAWSWLNEQTRKPLHIAYVGRPVPFPLYGTQFKNEVYYISVNKGLAQLHAYAHGNYRREKDYSTLHRNLQQPGNYRENPDYGIWLKNLLERNTDYLFIYSLHQTKNIEFPIEEEWAVNHPDRFNLVFKNETIRIYKVIQ